MQPGGTYWIEERHPGVAQLSCGEFGEHRIDDERGDSFGQEEVESGVRVQPLPAGPQRRLAWSHPVWELPVREVPRGRRVRGSTRLVTRLPRWGIKAGGLKQVAPPPRLGRHYLALQVVEPVGQDEFPLIGEVRGEIAVIQPVPADPGRGGDQPQVALVIMPHWPSPARISSPRILFRPGALLSFWEVVPSLRHVGSVSNFLRANSQSDRMTEP